ncbi:hypothetical protein B0T17DRAFT_612961 [Bombardia bombarda]|uniref:Uncharacterized protein n=1 Tax=Bombardia bombarda TaxID=252184 RepID=A0AA40CG22_9PEZI|nr:hypothetical protein B0T17DRAFT_612961 [Bombardia bombarda]
MASYLESFSKWLQLKIYQLEVTLSVYIFTPTEKFFFYSVLFLIVSLTGIATVLYLPQHVQFIVGRAWFYMHGDTQDAIVSELSKGSATAAAVKSLVGTATAAAQAVVESTTGVVREL